MCQVYNRPCKRDYHLDHYPNNKHCPGYCEVHIIEFMVKEKDKVINRLGKYVLETLLKPNPSTKELLKKVM
jgi:hypothetical protein